MHMAALSIHALMHICELWHAVCCFCICISCITVKEFNSTIHSLLLISLLRILPHEIISQNAVLYNLHHTTVMLYYSAVTPAN